MEAWSGIKRPWSVDMWTRFWARVWEGEGQKRHFDGLNATGSGNMVRVSSEVSSALVEARLLAWSGD